ncbi:hypothetical protein BJ138DRAFT_663237 [Hygrophoropsis aurantiaca]|uniref:Uncharacterized protein n=1 Tax=Hygrophoropsis aurantiaca TaxID=72124 RepID=A0ACB8AID5_9AGAM|nr:hypothetical protein BJ138DRAFT_663237 [Hygrophoropsis aurantiaca]
MLILPRQTFLCSSHVSKAWREIVHDTPTLWTNVCIHNSFSHPEMLQQILHYSKNCPLTACVVVGSVILGSHFNNPVDLYIKELFCHSDRIRSFRPLVAFPATLWEENVPTPHFPRLEELRVMMHIPEASPARLYNLFNSPQLQKVTWFFDQYPEFMLRTGAQIKELTIPNIAHHPVEKITALLRACPNLTYLDALSKFRTFPSVPKSLIPLRDLHTFRSTESGLNLCIAPNLRHLTLTIISENYEKAHLLQLFSRSPRIEYLSLAQWGDMTSDNVFFQIVSLTLCLVTIEITFRMPDFDVSTLNKVFEMLSRVGASTPILPKLQHLTLNVLHIVRDDEPPCVYDAEMLLRMLESRSIHAHATTLNGTPTVTALKSFTVKHDEYRGVQLHEFTPSWAASASQRLEVLKEHGLVLEGNIFTPFLSGRRAPGC